MKDIRIATAWLLPYLLITVTSPDKTLVFHQNTRKVVVHLKAGDGVIN